ncbi:hypothetical protein GGI15_001615 [Coemansia interrupta]|uniref:DNA-directed RNA polymerase I subunit RPA34.5 n=1 Tax=Coemansia interrupta TaxID=1126814 RepID=A0A9W8HPX1_9FUNG|nr:hypothetical protein GGI15_001615 [Coemansia interrupta]
MTSYKPPSDFLLQKGPSVAGFDQPSIGSKELWLIRIPDDVSANDLNGLKIKNPAGAFNGVALNETKINGKRYEIVTSAATNVCAEFKGMGELNVLVPDGDDDGENQGQLTLVPTRCTQLMSMIEKVDIPDATEYATTILQREKPVRPQPENMKLKFLPFGFYSAEEYRKQANLASETPKIEETTETTEPKTKKRKTKDIVTSDAAMDIEEAGDRVDDAKKKKKSKDKKSKKSKSKD